MEGVRLGEVALWDVVFVAPAEWLVSREGVLIRVASPDGRSGALIKPGSRDGRELLSEVLGPKVTHSNSVRWGGLSGSSARWRGLDPGSAGPITPKT